MKKIKFGIICPSEIAFRRFMPALQKVKDIEYVGVAIANRDEWNGIVTEEMIHNERKKAEKFYSNYGGKIFDSYNDLIESKEIDAIYLPLPPALHFKWAKKALYNGKHVFVEKPSTTNEQDTKILIDLAQKKDLALHENYMFIYHSQIDKVKELIEQKVVGEIRLIRAAFGFPRRSSNDFRYKKELGGGALLDCGGYPVKLVQTLLSDIKVDNSKLYYENDIDLYGAVQLSNNQTVAQISFGMDNSYKCELEIWGSIGSIYTGRVFTAPEGLETIININSENGNRDILIHGDDSFKKSIQIFVNCIKDKEIRVKEYQELKQQIKLIEDIIKEDQNGN